MILLLLACNAADEADPTDTGDTDTPSAPPNALPFHGGCTLEETRVSLGVDMVTTTIYDDEERVIDLRMSESNTRQAYVELDTYDGDCHTAYYKEESLRSTSYVVEWTSTCDAWGSPVTRTGTQYGTPFEITYENTYEDDRFVRSDGVYTSEGVSATLLVTRTWDGDQPLTYRVEVDGELSYDERWTWDGELLAAYALTNSDGASTTAYEYDAHGRVIGETYTWDGEASGGRTIAWMDAIFHASEQTWEWDEDAEPEVRATWTCSDTFPWSCEADADGYDGSELDGATDTLLGEAWDCP